MSLFSGHLIDYNISMKKLFLFLTTSLFFMPLSAVGNPFALESENPNYISLIGKIARREPVAISTLDWDASNHLQEEPHFFEVTQHAFTAWFNNVLSRIKPGSVQESQVKELLDAIRFGASPQSYYHTRSREDIEIAFGERQSIRRRCGGAACAQSGRIYIFYPKNESFEPIFIHEIGHALSLDDLYSNEYPSNAGSYGSGRQDSIMNESEKLTCDDADAIVNALYLTQKKLGLYPKQDFLFTSFCSNERTFKNAQMQNRQTEQIDYRGKRTIFTYCSDGPVHSLTKIDPRNPQELFSHQVITPCENPSSAPFSEKPNYTLEDFLTHRQNHITQNGEIIIDLPSYKNPLKLTLNQSVQFPVRARISDEKNNTIFLFARLNSEYNFVWEEPLGGIGAVWINGKNGYEKRSNAFVYVYNRNNPQEYYIYPRSHREQNACSVQDTSTCTKMKDNLEKVLPVFLEKYQMLPPAGDWTFSHAAENLRVAQNWEKFLSEHYPSYHVFMQKIRQEMEEELKKVTLKKVPLSR